MFVGRNRLRSGCGDSAVSAVNRIAASAVVLSIARMVMSSIPGGGSSFCSRIGCVCVQRRSQLGEIVRRGYSAALDAVAAIRRQMIDRQIVAGVVSIGDAAACEQSDIKHRRNVQDVIGRPRTRETPPDLVVAQQDLHRAAVRGARRLDREAIEVGAADSQAIRACPSAFPVR